MSKTSKVILDKSKINTFIISDKICAQAWKYVAPVEELRKFFSVVNLAKILICGYTMCVHYGIMLTIMHLLTLLTQQIPADWTWLGTYSCTLQSVTVMHKLEQIWDNMSVFFLPSFSPRIMQKACVQKRCRPAAWNRSLLMLCSVNQKSPEPSQQACVSGHQAPSPHLSTVLCNHSNEASSDNQFIQDQKLYLAFFLNKCIQVQLKAFQFCQVLVE